MWKDWLSFSRNEQHGMLLLFAVVLLLVILRLVLPWFFNDKGTVCYDDCEMALVIEEPDVVMREQDSYPSENQNHFAPFNPNHITVSQLQSMGVTSRAIVNWIKYLETGGRFFSAIEITKIYGLDSLLARQLIQYANCSLNPEPGFSINSGRGDFSANKIEHETETRKMDPPSSSQTAIVFHKQIKGQKKIGDVDTGIYDWVLEINSTTADEFMKLRGVGPVLSQRIVDFRTALGGYVSVAQIKEVYGVSEELFNQLLDYLSVDVSLVEGVDVNHSSVRRLKAHPYIDFYQARDIVECRKVRGAGMSLGDLKQLSSFDNNQIKRLIPYLKFYPDSLAHRLIHSE